MTYLILKVVHILAVVVFVGNIATGFFWHAHARRTRDPKALAHTLEGLIRSDRVLTGPSALLLIIAGVAAAIVGGFHLLRTGWILWTIVLFVLAGALFSTRVGPLQKQLHAIANAVNDGGTFDESRYAELAAKWRAWGGAATLALALAVVLMVLKPF